MTHPSVFFLFQADNVGSNQMAKIRYALRGSATVLMGKNTMIRKIISVFLKDNPGHPLELVRPRFTYLQRRGTWWLSSNMHNRFPRPVHIPIAVSLFSHFCCSTLLFAHTHPPPQILPRIVGNVGFIFTNGELGDIRDVIEAHRVPAPARVGSIAPIDVMVPPGPTGCDPGQTSFFQVLQVCLLFSFF